ncbi:ribosomal-protein-serine acetyltransferase [Siminovitchia terrae]|uniref:GNAT family N-acetyltransferase n=1 Tax=Siminovitchia terrae TaxID=1914933 RepID=UPI001B06454A|nr:GNAT family protein [Siminovitchia terrae]GIN92276.1 ribosomal-protein-serine acetyltransferase [Siminovitchia terrae]
MFVHVVDDEIYLKLVDQNDAVRLFELTDRSRCHLRQWLPWLDDTNNVNNTRQYIKESRDSFARHKSMNTSIVYKDEIVGVAGFNEFDWNNRSGSIGYWLDNHYTGRGIIVRSVGALTNFAFTELKMNRVEIRAAKENIKSRAVAERLGFQLEGFIRDGEWLYDHFVDHAVYGMLAREWEGFNSSSETAK